MEGGWLALRPSSVPIREACCDGWRLAELRKGLLFLSFSHCISSPNGAVGPASGENDYISQGLYVSCALYFPQEACNNHLECVSA